MTISPAGIGIEKRWAIYRPTFFTSYLLLTYQLDHSSEEASDVILL